MEKSTPPPPPPGWFEYREGLKKEATPEQIQALRDREAQELKTDRARRLLRLGRALTVENPGPVEIRGEDFAEFCEIIEELLPEAI